MRILFNEMKKIWSLKIICVLAVVGALFFYIFMQFYVVYYRGTDHPKTEQVYYCEELIRLYGPYVSEEQLAEYFSAEWERLVAEAEVYIAAMPVFAEGGVYSFADYSALREQDFDIEYTREQTAAIWALNDEECDFLGFKLQTIMRMEDDVGVMGRYIGVPESFWFVLSEKEQNRYLEIVASGENRYVMSGWVYDATNDYTLYFSVLVMLSVLVLVSPLVVSDRHGRVHYLLYSSKYGRRIMYAQLAATLISAFLLTTLLIVIFGGIFSVNGTKIFWEGSIASDFCYHLSVFPLTYGGWVTSIVGLLYATALSFAALAFILSRFSSNLITLVIKLVPVFAAAAFLCVGLFNALFTLGNAFYRFTGVFGTEAYVCVVLVIAGLAAALLVAKREKRVDV
jgi:hypothetical protein